MVGVVVLALGLGLSGVAAAQKPQGPKFVTFWLKASNGYGLVALANFSPPSGEGSLLLFLRKEHSQVLYGVPARVTPQGMDANLGRLGRISVDRVLTGRKKTVRRGCKGRVRRRVEEQRYEGTIEFHGEEGFADVSATRVPLEYFRLCFSGEGDGPGGDPSGARLNAEKRRRNGLEIRFEAVQQRLGASTELQAIVDERRGRIGIQRMIWGRAGAAALSYDNLLQTATVKPPAPYSGEATFRRDDPVGNQWTGNLSVDFPGRSNVRLTGRSFRASLEHPTR